MSATNDTVARVSARWDGDLGWQPPAGLATVDLDELSEQAGLMSRVDRKYVLPTEDLADVIEGLYH